MSIVKLKDENSFNIYHQTFLIDDDTDLNTLEQIYNCSFGDEARTPDGTVYVRHSDDYQGDKWVVKSSGSSGSGGSSDLPAVTSDDNGKGLSVQGTPVAGEVIVPEQTATYDDVLGAWPLTNCNMELFTEGATVILTIGDRSKVCTVFDAGEGFLGAEYSDYSGSIWYGDGSAIASIATDDPPTTLTVSCTLASYSYGWAVTPMMALMVPIIYNNGNPEAQMTAGDIMDAVVNGRTVIFYENDNGDIYYAPLIRVCNEASKFYFNSYLSGDLTIFVAESATDYPVINK